MVLHGRPRSPAVAKGCAGMKRFHQVLAVLRIILLMKNEPACGEAHVGSPSGLCDHMQAVESRSTEPLGGNEDTLFKRY